MPQNSSVLTASGRGPTIAQIRAWTEDLLQQGVDPKTPIDVSVSPYINQFDAGSWTLRASWTK